MSSKPGLFLVPKLDEPAKDEKPPTSQTPPVGGANHVDVDHELDTLVKQIQDLRDRIKASVKK